MRGEGKNTVVKVCCGLGRVGYHYQDKAHEYLKRTRLHGDEIWSWRYAKEKNSWPEMKAKGAGDVWTLTAVCRHDRNLLGGWVRLRPGDRTESGWQSQFDGQSGGARFGRRALGDGSRATFSTRSGWRLGGQGQSI